jgi:hypothetical protein
MEQFKSKAIIIAKMCVNNLEALGPEEKVALEEKFIAHAIHLSEIQYAE